VSEMVGVDEVRKLAAAVVGGDPARTKNAWDVENDALACAPENAVVTRYVAYHCVVSRYAVWQSVEESPGEAKRRREGTRDYACFHYDEGR